MKNNSKEKKEEKD